MTPASLYNLPDADQYAAAARRRRLGLLVAGLVLSVVCGIIYTRNLSAGFAAAPTLLLALLVPVLLWRYPRFALWLTVAGACLFELGLVTTDTGDPYPDSLTDRVPMFWNVNTIFQIYGHINFKGIPLNLFEILMLTAGLCSVFRTVYTRQKGLRGGVLLVPIGAYMLFVIMGWVNGVATGGDFKISLQEVRSQLYFGLGYLLTVNMVRERRQLLTLLSLCVGCIGLKAVLMCVRRYITLHGQLIPDQGVGAHEEAFFFDAFGLLLLTLWLCRALPRLRRVMWYLLPFVSLANLAMNRRAATAALLIVVPLLLAAAYRALPERRRLIRNLAIGLTIGLSIYYPLFRNSTGALGQPARAIQSNFAPDARDASSNASRDAENANLMATIHMSPPQGYGYGRPYLHMVPMVDITKDYALEELYPAQPDFVGVGACRLAGIYCLLDDGVRHSGAGVPDPARPGRRRSDPLHQPVRTDGHSAAPDFRPAGLAVV